MNRLPLLSYDSADREQQELWDAIVDSRGETLELVTPEGRLAGPFESFVRRPKLGKHLINVGAVVRFDSALDSRLLELAITTVGAHWRSEFEFWAHSRLALEAGIADDIIEALAAGSRPSFTNADEQAIYDYTISLCADGRVDQVGYDAAVNAVGIDAVVDLTHTIGYYCHISLLLNAFEVALPTGVDPRFDEPANSAVTP